MMENKFNDKKAIEAAIMLKDYCEGKDCDEDCVFYKSEQYAGREYETGCAIGREPWNMGLKPIIRNYEKLYQEKFESGKEKK